MIYFIKEIFLNGMKLKVMTPSVKVQLTTLAARSWLSHLRQYQGPVGTVTIP